MHGVIFTGISIINQKVQKLGSNWHEKRENRGENFGKIWEKSPKKWGKSQKIPNSINAQYLISRGGFNNKGTSGSAWLKNIVPNVPE